LTKEENDGVFPFIEGERIDLVTGNSKWADLSCKWTNDPEVRRYSRNAWPTTLEEVKKWFEPSSDQGMKDFVVFSLYHKKDKKPIGVVGFNRINWLNRNANIFWTIGEKEYWGRGIAVDAGIFTPNKRSLRVAERLGFGKEAVLKEDLYVDGTYVDTHIFALLKKDWMEKNK
jgi:RimJ/RimL family protein N-acetyltransferase